MGLADGTGWILHPVLCEQGQRPTSTTILLFQLRIQESSKVMFLLIGNKNDLLEVDMFRLIPDIFFYFPSISQNFKGSTWSAECPSSAVRDGLPPLLPVISQTSARLQKRDQKASSTSWILRLESPQLVESEVLVSTCSSHHQGEVSVAVLNMGLSLWNSSCLLLLCS